MSANPIAWRRVKALNRQMDEQFVHASTSSTSDDGRYWWCCIRHDGSALYVEPKTLETEPVESDTSTMRVLRTRDTRFGQEDWLAELDERAREMSVPAPASPS